MTGGDGGIVQTKKPSRLCSFRRCRCRSDSRESDEPRQNAFAFEPLETRQTNTCHSTGPPAPSRCYHHSHRRRCVSCTVIVTHQDMLEVCGFWMSRLQQKHVAMDTRSAKKDFTEIARSIIDEPSRMFSESCRRVQASHAPKGTRLSATWTKSIQRFEK